jgi:hypothetical protein
VAAAQYEYCWCCCFHPASGWRLKLKLCCCCDWAAGEDLRDTTSASDGNFRWTKTDLMLVMGTSVGLKLILLLAMAWLCWRCREGNTAGKTSWHDCYWKVLLYWSEAAHGWSCWSGRGTQPLLLTTEKMIGVGLGKRRSSRWSLLSGTG